VAGLKWKSRDFQGDKLVKPRELVTNNDVIGATYKCLTLFC